MNDPRVEVAIITIKKELVERALRKAQDDAQRVYQEKQNLESELADLKMQLASKVPELCNTIRDNILGPGM